MPFFGYLIATKRFLVLLEFSGLKIAFMNVY